MFNQDQCESCLHEEIDGEVCRDLTYCGVLGGQCLRLELNKEETQYPEVQTHTRTGFRASYRGQRVEPIVVNSDLL